METDFLSLIHEAELDDGAPPDPDEAEAAAEEAERQAKKTHQEVEDLCAKQAKAAKDLETFRANKPLQALDDERDELEAALSKPELSREDEVEIRERLAFVTARRPEVEASLRYAGSETWELEAQLEASEEEHDDLRLALEQALAPGGKPTAKARRLQREYDALMQTRAAMSAEVQARALRGATAIGMSSLATKKAARELKAEDAAAAAAASDWRRGKLVEDLAASYVSRLEARAKQIEAAAWADSEVAVGRSLLGTAVGHSSMSDVAREREAQAKLDAARVKYGG